MIYQYRKGSEAKTIEKSKAGETYKKVKLNTCKAGGSTIPTRKPGK